MSQTNGNPQLLTFNMASRDPQWISAVKEVADSGIFDERAKRFADAVREMGKFQEIRTHD